MICLTTLKKNQSKMSYIHSISTYTPSVKVSNDEISKNFPEWNGEKIFNKLGIKSRNISKKDEFVSDMSTKVINKLLDEYNIDKSTIDFLIIVTQSPDYSLPTTACIVQNQVGLSTNCGAIDINQGCSGYIYGLSIADGLIAGGNFNNIILVTAETYSKYINKEDKNNLSIFGDGATATLITKEKSSYKIGKFSLGSDGSGCDNLIVRNGGARNLRTEDENENDNFLYMNGSEIFDFTSKNVPDLVNQNLDLNKTTIEKVDYFVFHQANTFMLNFLRKRIGIPEQKFVVEMENYGNTVSSTIPIALKENAKTFTSGSNEIMLVGFGVGYSWGAVVIYKMEN